MLIQLSSAGLLPPRQVSLKPRSAAWLSNLVTLLTDTGKGHLRRLIVGTFDTVTIETFKAPRHVLHPCSHCALLVEKCVLFTYREEYR
jgi:hypothetical protein